MNVSAVDYPYHGILLSNKKEGTIDILNNLDKYPENYAEGKKKMQIPKDCKLYNFIYVTFFKGQNCEDGEQSISCQRLRRESV